MGNSDTDRVGEQQVCETQCVERADVITETSSLRNLGVMDVTCRGASVGAMTRTGTGTSG